MSGTVDVVSKTNTEDLTLEYGQSKEYYENKFQETANKYIDNNYAISAKTVNQNDLDYFTYDNEFWVNNVNDTNIVTSQGTWELKNYKMYIIPYVEKYFENIDEYNVGDIIEYLNNGVNRWVVVSKEEWNPSSLVLIPETPIELVIDSVDDNIGQKVNQIIESFNNDVFKFGNYFYRFGPDNLTNLIPNFLNQQTERIYFYYFNCYYKNNNTLRFECGGILYYENGEFSYHPGIFYTDSNPYTLGYRPVVTLKIKNEIQDKDKKEISSKLQVGDYVKYEIKGYKNWKVLSIDKDLRTVDIISGGIVKNLTLSGKEDWDNYEDIIQREVDEYKYGEQAKKATTLTSLNLKILKEIDKSILSRYWLLSKNINKNRHQDFNSVKYINYNISTISLYKYDNYEMYLDNISLYTDVIDEEGQDRYKNDILGHTYTAGLRPVITLKLDSVEKLPEEETKEIEESTEKQEKIFIKEQESKNKNYKGPSKVDDSTSSTGNNEVKSNDSDNTKKDNIIDNNTSNVEKIVYKDKPFYKYGFLIFLMTSIIELIIIMLLLKKIKR